MTLWARLPFIPALLFCIGAAFLFWRWLGAPQAVPDVPGGRLQCLSYTPFAPGDMTATAPSFASTEIIDADLAVLSRYTDCLRLYTPLGNSERIVPAASRLGFRILLGAWIGTDLEQNDKEIAAALDLARRYPATVSAIVVGNEVLLRKEMSASELVRLISEVKQQSPVPVAYADVMPFITRNPEVAEAADLVLVHLLPYWDDPAPIAAEPSIEEVLKSYQEFVQQHPHKSVMLGETGWPSKGRVRGEGVPSLVNQARYVRGFAQRAGELGISYNLIEALDQPWKRAHEGTVGGYWGILDSYRNPKFSLEGPVSNYPDWRVAFVASVFISTIFLLTGLLARNRGARQWLILTPVSLLLGLMLVFQWDFVRATSRSVVDLLAGAAGALLTIAAALMLSSSAGSGSVAPLSALAHALRSPRSTWLSPQLRRSAFVALVMLPAAWHGLVLAFDPRYRDIPLGFFALPALAVLLRVRVTAGDAHREEAMLSLILIITGVMQLENANLETYAWLTISVALVIPWIVCLRNELARIGRIFIHPRQPQERSQHG